MRSLTISPLFVTGILMLSLAGCQRSDSNTPVSSTSNDPIAAPAPAPVSAPPVELPSGTLLEARLDQALSTQRNRPGDTFDATLETPVNVDGREIIPAGARVQGRVTTAHPSGHLEGRAVLGITLNSIQYRGATIPITTSMDSRATEAHKKRNIEIIGGGAGVGALIGGLVGGGKGAGIGAAAGGAAGTAGAAASGVQHVEIPAETVFTFRLKGPVSVQP
jgi:hypothetical protein